MGLPPHDDSESHAGDRDGFLRAFENERTLNSLLRTVTQTKSLTEILLECLDVLLAVSWLSILPKGGIFLVQEEPDTLNMVAERNLSPELLTLCAKVPFGRCLCGRAAASREMVVTTCLDERHEIRFDGMTEHGHYSVPILDGGNVVGVLVLYLPHGHPSARNETDFLAAVTDILSLVIRQKRVEEDLAAANRRLEHLVNIDELTGLYNRRFLVKRLAEEITESDRTAVPLSLLMIDIDFFKRINDTFGHDGGDRILRELSGVFGNSVRPYDIVARFGGEEFCIVLPHTKQRTARKVAERVRANAEQARTPIPAGDEAQATISIGLATWRTAQTPDELLKQADALLYRAKHQGRNRVESD